jgi:hypothetical protein
LYFHKHSVETDGSELARKAVDSAIKLAQKTKPSFAVHVMTPGETKVTQYYSRDAEWENI